jgi:FAD:protein FMN transferase
MPAAATPVFGVAFDAMASRCEIRLAAGDDQEARRLAQYAIDEVRRIETKYSRYRADSIVWRINAAAGIEWVECDDETLALFGYADALHQASGGLFDITSGVLRRAWNFKQATVPDAKTLEALLGLIDWPGVGREGNRMRLQRTGMEIDFGGFGKEYAADRAATALMEQGVQSGYVNLGGDMRFIGPQPDGQPWRIGIQDPRKPDGIVAVIPIAGGALATSGDYERYFEADGRRYCHILDPRSGFPVNHWRSISVLAPVAIAAGSCSTIAMLKEAEALPFLDEAGVAYLAIDREGAIHSRNLQNLS